MERLLDGEAKPRKEAESDEFRVKGHGARRIGENGEALRYIEMVLRQLRRASRDHRKLVEQRSNRSFPFSSTSCLDEYLSGRWSDVRGSLAVGRGQRRTSEKKSGVSRETVERLREVGGSRKEEPQELAEYPSDGRHEETVGEEEAVREGNLPIGNDAQEDPREDERGGSTWFTGIRSCVRRN